MDYLVFSHLRWDFVYQRPQHLLSRAAEHGRVFFWEEPVPTDGDEAFLELRSRAETLQVVVPRIPQGATEAESLKIQEQLLRTLISGQRLKNYVAWYYTPMAMRFTSHLEPVVTVYDCMDELSAFRGAPPGLRAAEQQLFQRADIVFTGGQSLYESKRQQHPNAFPFPSSIDRTHFNKATSLAEPADQAVIAGPKIGYAGVIDERLDLDLLARMAELRPEWSFVMIGPVVKIDPNDLPKRANIFYLGGKQYQELPAYFSGWSLGMMPFAINESTRYISPTKTPEYLAAGLPVVSTAIHDVVTPYGAGDLVSIASTPEEFVQAAEAEMSRVSDEGWRARVNSFLSECSWDSTWNSMEQIIEQSIERSGLDEPLRPTTSSKLDPARAYAND